ncbi:MAG TPA: methyltransferase [Sphingorhabdus sp.]|jgi:demethylspheroidene O-methyltransferase|nr:methyltransferase [Sphingorhabdus sp.]
MSSRHDNLTLKSRWVMRRNAILGSEKFQRWASRTPLIRSIARRRAAAQFDMIAGFIYSQILGAFVQSGLITFLQVGLRNADEIAALTGLSPHATDRLLRAGQALQIAESPQAGLWTLGEAGAALSCNEGALAMVRHHHLLYGDLADPVALLKADRAQETALSAYWTYASRGDSKSGAAGYSALMAATQPMVAQQIIDAYDFGRHRAMLDIGGGSGAFVSAVAETVPQLRSGIFDLPEVIDEATKRLAAGGKAELHPGSFRHDPLPTGYDLVTLVRILHDHDDDVAQALLAKIHAALPPGGKLLIVEPMAQADSAPRMGDAYFGLYLWAMGSGRPRCREEIGQRLTQAGFSQISTVPTALPIITGAIVATK